MVNIKLPRKRKKAYIKARGRNDYLTTTLINEVLVEEKEVRLEYNITRYYTFKKCKPTKLYRNGFKPVKKW